MASLRATEIQSWYDDLATLYAANTVAMVHKVLRGIASHAVTDGVIRANPCDGRRKPKDMEKPPVAWDATEARAFLSGVSTDDSAIPLILMLATGMRIGEALALHWRDVDFDARTVRVTHTLQDSTKGVKVVEATKASSSHRTVSLPAVAVLALRRQRELSTGSLVFTYPDGRPLGADSVRRKLTAACKRLNLRRLTPHGLRRTAVTLMLMRGVHPNVVSRQTGHTVELMLRRYAAVSSELQQQAASVLDDVFDAPQKRTP